MNKLATAIEQGLIKSGTNISAKVKTVGFGGISIVDEREMVVKVTDSDKVLGFGNNKYYKIPIDRILSVEGMSPDRFCKAHNIK